MKVTVCFGRTRVVVPCGDGNIRVRSLVEQAAMRYKKAIAKTQRFCECKFSSSGFSDSENHLDKNVQGFLHWELGTSLCVVFDLDREFNLLQRQIEKRAAVGAYDPSYWVQVHRLEHGDGGILDLDDMLYDVVDDKDRAMVTLQMADNDSVVPTGWFHLVAVYEEQDPHNGGDGTSASSTGTQSPDLFVSEMSSTSAFQPYQANSEIEVTATALLSRWVAIFRTNCLKVKMFKFFSRSHVQQPQVDKTCQLLYYEDTKRKVRALLVQTNPTEIIQFAGPQLLVSRCTAINQTQVVEEPMLTGAYLAMQVTAFKYLKGQAVDRKKKSTENKKDELSEQSQLGGLTLHWRVHLTQGLLVKRLEAGGKAEKEHLFQENDCIVKINHEDIRNLRFEQAQNIFRQAMRTPVILFHVVPATMKRQYDILHQGPLAGSTPEPSRRHTTLPHALISRTCSAHSPSLQRRISSNLSNSSYPKKKGHRFNIQLKKGPEGLGFSITSRDVPIGGTAPIYIKNILPRGAAIQDGRLKAGDRLLEVSGVDLSGKSQEEVVALLRATPMGGIVNMVVIRQEDSILPREVHGEDDMVLTFDGTREFMTFEIPLNDSGSAGLGVSVKGNRSKEDQADLGIFDGRLHVNDQLIAVNGESLIGMTNQDAMEALRKSMSIEGNKRGMIQLIVARRVAKDNEMARTSPHPINYVLDSNERRISQSLYETTGGSDSNLAPRTNNITVAGHYQFSPTVNMPKDDTVMIEDDGPPLLPANLSINPLSPDEDPDVEFQREGFGRQSMSEKRIKQYENAAQLEIIKSRKSKSMDLGSAEQEVGPLQGQKRSSSLESLQAAVTETSQKVEIDAHMLHSLDEDTEGSSRSGRESMSTSGDLSVGAGLTGNLSIDDSARNGAKPGLKEKQKMEREKYKDKNKSKKNVLKGLGEIFSYAPPPFPRPPILQHPESPHLLAPPHKCGPLMAALGDVGGQGVERRLRTESNQKPHLTFLEGNQLVRFGKNRRDEHPDDNVERKNSTKYNVEDAEATEKDTVRMRLEQERIQAKTRELRDRQAKEREYAEIQDVASPTFSSDEDHTYAGIGSLDSSVDSSCMDADNHHYHLPQSPQNHHVSLNLEGNGPPLEALYAQVNKPRNGRPAVTESASWGPKKVREQHEDRLISMLVLASIWQQTIGKGLGPGHISMAQSPKAVLFPKKKPIGSQMVPSNHDRIQRLRNEFQQAKHEVDPEDHQQIYGIDQSWVTSGTETQSGRHSATVETQFQMHQQEDSNGFQQTQRLYNSLPRQPRKSNSTLSKDSRDRLYAQTEGLQSSKDNFHYSASQGSRNGYLGTPNFNARVLLETQELLRQEQRRKEQEVNRASHSPLQEISDSTNDHIRDHSEGPDMAPRREDWLQNETAVKNLQRLCELFSLFVLPDPSPSPSSTETERELCKILISALVSAEIRPWKVATPEENRVAQQSTGKMETVGLKTEERKAGVCNGPAKGHRFRHSFWLISMVKKWTYYGY
ncbi:unnamed protein product [Menidia menidia]|uniref:(Atlantic silverside) hypothetical protein n=1 Tax=Menidia menidia TaxID=238744 RepID=A0A8S4ASV7_9TELE|nr:unnamed protein product [Menidia menidia]